MLGLAVLVLGCGGFEERAEDGLRVLEATRRTDGDGHLAMRVDVVEGDGRLLVTGLVDFPSRIYVRWLEDADGSRVFDADEVWESPNSLTGAIVPDWATTFNWPILPDDVPLSPGRWTVELGVIDEENFFDGGVPIEVSVLLAEGADLPTATLDVNLLYGGAVADDAHARASIDEAVAQWRELYEAAGVTLVISEDTLADGILYGPGLGSREEWTALASDTPLRSVNIVFLEEMLEGEVFYGLTGSIPGPLVPSINSGVAVNMLVSSGVDGRFQADEVRLLAETLAHEVGHFLGNFHPVELDYATWDSLDDTPECTSSSACVSALSRNVMYPEPICDGSTCAPQPELTADQGTVIRGYTGVR